MTKRYRLLPSLSWALIFKLLINLFCLTPGAPAQRVREVIKPPSLDALCDELQSDMEALRSIRIAADQAIDYRAKMPKAFSDACRCIAKGERQAELVDALNHVAGRVRGNAGAQALGALAMIARDHPSYPTIKETAQEIILNQTPLVSSMEMWMAFSILLRDGENVNPRMLPFLKQQCLHTREPKWLPLWGEHPFPYKMDRDDQYTTEVAAQQVALILLLTPVAELMDWAKGIECQEINSPPILLDAITKTIGLGMVPRAPEGGGGVNIVDSSRAYIGEERINALMGLALFHLRQNPNLIAEVPSAASDWPARAVVERQTARVYGLTNMLRYLRLHNSTEAEEMVGFLENAVADPGTSQEARERYELILAVLERGAWGLVN